MNHAMTIDGFDNREFTVEELTYAMSVIPNNYNLVTNLGLFGDPVPIAETYVGIEIDNGVLSILPTVERGGAATRGTQGKRKRMLVEVPHIPHEDEVKAADIQGLRAFGSKAPELLEDKVNQKLLTMTMKHQLTHEWYRVRALQGEILDADGSSMLDLHTMFGVTELAVAFGGASTINEYIRQVSRHIEDNLLGDVMSGVACLCSPEFMEMLLTDTEVLAAYNAAAAADRLHPNMDDVRYSFYHMGVLFIEYRGQASVLNSDGTTTVRKFIPAGDARFVPLGTIQSAFSVAAPGDFVEALNNPGELYYAKAETMKFNRGLELHTQSNFLPVWTRPACLVRGHTGAS